jgi:hypothetical protein
MFSVFDRVASSASLRRVLTGGIAAAALAATLVPAGSAAQPADKAIPQLMSREFGWSVSSWDFLIDAPPGAGHGPMKTDPAYPYASQIQNGARQFIPLFVPIVDTKDPILKPWAAKQMQESNDELLKNPNKLNFVAQSRCWPGGVPGQLLFLEPVYFIQRPESVYIVWQRDHHVRRIALTDKHSDNVKPSWFGESIGHYENGDTLVVDTIGISAKSHIDSFRTPHTEKQHVVERFTISPDGRSLKAIVTVDDPDTFNGPLTLTQTWRKNEVEMIESNCAEDGGYDPFEQNLHPIPQASKPDF